MNGGAAVDRVLETPRLRLRTVDEPDAARVVELMTRPISHGLASWPYPLDEATAAARLRELRQLVTAGNGLCFAIEPREGDLIGMVSVIRARLDARRGGLGYWLGEAYQRQGYMSEAVTAAVSDAFLRLDLHAVEAGAQPENVASLAIMRRLGMRAIGERAMWAAARQREEICAYYEITREEHAARGAV